MYMFQSICHLRLFRWLEKNEKYVRPDEVTGDSECVYGTVACPITVSLSKMGLLHSLQCIFFVSKALLMIKDAYMYLQPYVNNCVSLSESTLTHSTNSHEIINTCLCFSQSLHHTFWVSFCLTRLPNQKNASASSSVKYKAETKCFSYSPEPLEFRESTFDPPSNGLYSLNSQACQAVCNRLYNCESINLFKFCEFFLGEISSEAF